MKNILFAGNGTYKNRGCEAIVRGSTEIFKTTFGGDFHILNTVYGDPKVVKEQKKSEKSPYVTSYNMQRWSFIRTYNFRRVNKYLKLKINDESHVLDKLIPKSDIALQVGGDNYSLCYGKDVLMMFVRNDEDFLKAGLPLVLWCASVGPFDEDPATEEFMARHLSKFSLILVRETESLKYLESLGITDNVKLVSDPAFAMIPEKPSLSPELNYFIDKKPLGINLSPMAGLFLKDSGKDWRTLALDCVQSAIDATGMPVLLIPHVTVAGDNDYGFLSGLVPDLRGDVKVLPGTLSAAEYKYVISKTSMLAAARTHATIAGFSTATPTLSIGYSIKARGLNKDIFGGLDYMIPVDKLSGGAFAEKVKGILANSDGIRADLEAKSAEMKKKALEAGACIKELI